MKKIKQIIRQTTKIITVNADKTDKDTETTGKLEPADDMTQDKEDTKKDDEDGAV